MKLAFIEGFFPEMKGKFIYGTGRGEGCSAKAAINRAMPDLLRHVKGKRVSVIKCTITLTDKADNEVMFITDTDTDSTVDANVRDQREALDANE